MISRRAKPEPEGFKRVPAIDKCCDILELMAKLKEPLTNHEISSKLNYHASTTYNLLKTLADREFVECNKDKEYSLGVKFYALGKIAVRYSKNTINTIHPFLEEINLKTNLSVFFGIRSNFSVIILDKIDSSRGLTVTREIGESIAFWGGATSEALLSQLSDEEVDRILSGVKLKKLTPHTCTNKAELKKRIKRVREEGIAIDKEERTLGLRAVAVPLNLPQKNVQALLWVLGLTGQIEDRVIPSYSTILKDAAARIEDRSEMLDFSKPMHLWRTKSE